MKRQSRKNRYIRIYLIGIPLIFITGLIYLFTTNYSTSYKPIPFDTIIYNADRYKKSSRTGWHTIDLKSFSIETPADFYFYLERGIHGGTVGGLTNAKDTINFVFGRYYFEACEGAVMGEKIGTCDTLKMYRVGIQRLLITKTDDAICAFSKDFKNDHIFKAWANPEIKIDIDKVFKSVKFN